MAVEFFNDGQHKCIDFYDLVSGDGIQANQFLVVNGRHSALIDVIGSHQDPDILSSLNQWMLGSNCKVIVPKLWERFIPHFAPKLDFKNRLIGIPDE